MNKRWAQNLVTYERSSQILMCLLGVVQLQTQGGIFRHQSQCQLRLSSDQESIKQHHHENVGNFPGELGL